MTVQKRQRMERAIARRIVRDALAAGYRLNVDNGGDTDELPAPSASFKEVTGAMFATDDEYLRLYKDGKRVGSVYLVYGNDGYDAICDYSVSLESLLSGANALADRLAS